MIVKKITFLNIISLFGLKIALFFAITFIALASPYKAFAAFSDLKFGQAQIADSQWNTQTCISGTTCEIFSMNPGVAYKFPFTDGLVSWFAGDYVSFVANEDPTTQSSYPWTAVQYDSTGSEKEVLGPAKVTMSGTSPDGNSYFFMVGPESTGQLFSGSLGLDSTNGFTFTGTLDPDGEQLDTFSAGLATTPLAAGDTVETSNNPDPTGSGDAESEPDSSLLGSILSYADELSAGLTNVSENLAEVDGSIEVDTLHDLGSFEATMSALSEYGFGSYSQVNADVYSRDIPASLLNPLNPLTLELGNLSTTAIGSLQSGSMNATFDASGLLAKASSTSSALNTTANMKAEQYGAIVNPIAIQNVSLNQGSIDGSIVLALADVNTNTGNLATTAIGALGSGAMSANISGQMGEPDDLAARIVQALVGTSPIN